MAREDEGEGVDIQLLVSGVSCNASCRCGKGSDYPRYQSLYRELAHSELERLNGQLNYVTTSGPSPERDHLAVTRDT